MQLKVSFLSSPNMNNDPLLKDKAQLFLDEIGAAAGETLVFADPAALCGQGFSCFFVGSGGSESAFLDAIAAAPGPYVFITTNNNNSLAAAMEMLAYLNEHDQNGVILHGTAAEIAKKLIPIADGAASVRRFCEKRLGIVGRAVERIASFIDEDRFVQDTDCSICWIPMEELIAEIQKGGYPDNEWTASLLASGYDRHELEKSLGIYGGLCRIVEKYRLDALSVRCFDLLVPTKSTGCLALAILNAQGIPAACEGDVKSLVTMLAAYAVTGSPGFMANPSRFDPVKRELVFAHCTLPLNMPCRYGLTTHFESGTGVALAGVVPEGPCTVVKTGDDFSKCYVGRGEILENLREPDLCRTQIRVRMAEDVDYFLTRPIANHHIVCCGDYADQFRRFFELMAARRNHRN